MKARSVCWRVFVDSATVTLEPPETAVTGIASTPVSSLTKTKPSYGDHDLSLASQSGSLGEAPAKSDFQSTQLGAKPKTESRETPPDKSESYFDVYQESQYDGTVTFETSAPVLRSIATRVFSPHATSEAEQWLNGDLKSINEQALLISYHEARRMHVQISKAEIRVKRSWEGEFSELVLQVFAEVNIPQSLALWDAVGDTIQQCGVGWQ